MEVKTLVRCICCERDVEKLVAHHWYDNDNNLQEKLICASCNSILSDATFATAEYHKLPEWSVQVSYVRERIRTLELESVKRLEAYQESMQRAQLRKNTCLIRDFEVLIENKSFIVTTFEGDFNRARYLGCKEFIRMNPKLGYKVSVLTNSGKAKVRVANDKRVKY